MHRTVFCVALATTTLLWSPTAADAQPATEGGLKQAFHEVKDEVQAHVEIVADKATGEIRIHLSETWTEQKDGKKHWWCANLGVREMTIRGKWTFLTMPVKRLPPGKNWFGMIPPISARGGYSFYSMESKGKFSLDGGKAKELKFKAGTSPTKARCLVAKLDMSKATKIRILEVGLAVLDPGKRQKPWIRRLFEKGATGLGKTWTDLAKTDIELKLFTDSIAKIKDMDKHRKPERPGEAPGD